MQLNDLAQLPHAETTLLYLTLPELKRIADILQIPWRVRFLLRPIVLFWAIILDFFF